MNLSSDIIEIMRFPDVSNSNEDGLLAMGGDLNVNTLISAYAQGIFPWFNDDQPILWWSPDPRMVLYPADLKISRSLKKTLKKEHFKVTINHAFSRVIDACALRGQQNSLMQNEETWITDDMQTAYTQLHEKGYAHSMEVWQNQQLVGGLYGVCLGNVFFGESMFSRVSDASKVAFVHLAAMGFDLIDCQVSSAHLASLGAKEIPRADFLKQLKNLDIKQTKARFSEPMSQTNINNVINK